MWLDIKYMQTKRPNKKLFDKLDGPFLITKIINPHVYKLELIHNWTIHPVFYTNYLTKIWWPLAWSINHVSVFLFFIIDDESRKNGKWRKFWF